MERPGWTPTGQLATCTSWNDAKSYGFVRIDGAGAGSREGRVWVSREALLDLGEKKLWRGQAARCEVAESAQGDGLAATSVTWVANMDDEAVAMAAKNEEDKIDALVSFTGLGRATCQRYLEESEGDYEGACLQAYRYVVARAWDPRSGATQVDELVDVLVLAVPSSRSTIRSLASLLFPPHPHTTHLTHYTHTHTHTPRLPPPPLPAPPGTAAWTSRSIPSQAFPFARASASPALATGGAARPRSPSWRCPLSTGKTCSASRSWGEAISSLHPRARTRGGGRAVPPCGPREMRAPAGGGMCTSRLERETRTRRRASRGGRRTTRSGTRHSRSRGPRTTRSPSKSPSATPPRLSWRPRRSRWHR